MRLHGSIDKSGIIVLYWPVLNGTSNLKEYFKRLVIKFLTVYLLLATIISYDLYIRVLQRFHVFLFFCCCEHLFVINIQRYKLFLFGISLLKNIITAVSLTILFMNKIQRRGRPRTCKLSEEIKNN